MKLSYFIASRYLFSKKKQNVINIISLVSVIGVSVGTMALVIVLSVFNGIDEMVRDMVGPFNADISVSPIEGKFFAADSNLYKQIERIDGVAYFSEIVEESSLVKYESRQRPIIIKGTNKNYGNKRKLDSALYDGAFYYNKKNFEYVVLGYGVAKDLGVGLNFVASLDFYFPKRNKTDISNPLNAFSVKHAYPAGVFSLEQSIDSKYVLCSVRFAQKLLGIGNRISALEIDIEDGADEQLIQEKILKIVGNNFKVKNRYEQNETLFKMMESEKMAIFFILVFILLIASFNIVGSLTMLIIDKKKDIKTFSYMGMQKSNIQKIFWYEGWMISIIGSIIGGILGVIICYIQKEFEFITLGGGVLTYAYPVKILVGDIFLVIFTVLLIGYFASRYPVKFLIKRLL